jgi:hypothetical protein
MKPGRSLEKLVECLEKALTENTDTAIESPKKLRDQVTGQLREYDVVITTTQHHRNFRIAIECRDRSRPVDNTQVEAFWAKCQHTETDQGIIVSSQGFYKTALRKAQHLHIECLSLEQVASFDWLHSPEVVVYSREVKHTHWTIIPVDQENNRWSTDLSLVDQKGIEISHEILDANVRNRLDGYLVEPDDSTSQCVDFEFTGKGTYIRDNQNDRIEPVKKLIVSVEYDVAREYAPSQLLRYQNKTEGTHIVDAAVTPIEFGDKIIKLALIYHPDQGGKLMVIPDNQEDE